jgi:hypothetical protein
MIYLYLSHRIFNLSSLSILTRNNPNVHKNGGASPLSEQTKKQRNASTFLFLLIILPQHEL